MSVQKITAQHILVKKIIRVDEKVKDKDGKLLVRDPINGKIKDPDSNEWIYPPTEKLDVVEELIRIDEIKSARHYFKSHLHKKWLVGDVTAIYMIADETRKPFEMFINENLYSFSERIGSVMIPESE